MENYSILSCILYFLAIHISDNYITYDCFQKQCTHNMIPSGKRDKVILIANSIGRSVDARHLEDATNTLNQLCMLMESIISLRSNINFLSFFCKQTAEVNTSNTTQPHPTLPGLISYLCWTSPAPPQPCHASPYCGQT